MDEKVDEESRFTVKNRVKKDAITLSGVARTEEGHLTRSKYFEFLKEDLDDYSDITFTEEQARKISTHLKKLSTGTSAMVPMHCAASRCPFASTCPFMKENINLVGRQCLVETNLMKQWLMEYMDEYEIDPLNITDVGYANELAELMILERRVNMNIAKPENAELITDATIGVDRDGDPIVQKQISPFMELKEKIANRRSKVIKLMVGDRQEQYKKEAALKVKQGGEPSSQMAAMRARIESLSRQLDTMGKGEEGDVLHPDDILDAEE